MILSRTFEIVVEIDEILVTAVKIVTKTDIIVEAVTMKNVIVIILVADMIKVWAQMPQ